MLTSKGGSRLWFSVLAVSEISPPEQIAAWRELIRMPPEALGIERSRWTLATLRAADPLWCHYTLGGLWRLLLVLRIGYKRGRHYVHSPDPDYIAKRDAAQACVDAARQHPDRVATYYLDEFSFYRQPTLAQAWHPVGHGQPLACRSHRSNVYHRILGALNAVTGQVVFFMGKRTNVPFICRFLRQLRQLHPDVVVLNVILDNWYRVHDHADVQETAREEGITLVYLPTYAPWLNPIEKLWRKANQDVLHLHRYSDHWEELIQRMHDFLSRYTSGSSELLRYVGLLPN
jgi:transposase